MHRLLFGLVVGVGLIGCTGGPKDVPATNLDRKIVPPGTAAPAGAPGTPAPKAEPPQKSVKPES